MIPRYNRPKIKAIWSDQNKYEIWTEIECLIAEQLSNIGTIPKKAAKEIRKKAKFNIEEIIPLFSPHSFAKRPLQPINTKKANNIKIGDPMDLQTQMGPLATLEQIQNIQKKVEETVKGGGKIITGG